MNVEDYTQHQLNGDNEQTGEGTYRGFPVSWTVEQSTAEGSQSVAIAFRFGIAQRWLGKEQGWSPEWPAGYFTEHRAWIVKKDGTPNERAIQGLAECGLWDGDFDKLSAPMPPSVMVLLSVEAETYEGKARFRANWVNPNADEPTPRGGFKPADASLLQSLRQRFEGPMKAIAGGQPKTPPATPPGTTPAPQVGQPQPPPPAVLPPAVPPPAVATPAVSAPAVVQTPPDVQPPTGGLVRPPVQPPAATGTPDDPIQDDDTPF